MVSETPDILSFPSLLKYEPLNQKQLDALKAGTYHLLAEVGVRFPSRKALEIFADHGAQVNLEDKVVRIPQDLVERALSTAPRAFILGGREARFDLLLDGTRSYLATDGCGTRVLDPETRQERPSRTADIARMARVCDALPMVSFFWPMVSAQDHGMGAPVYECHAGLTHTLKHVRGGTTVPPELARLIVEMAMVAAGSEAVCRARPPICANICTIAPLAHDKNGIEAALVYAQAGIPTSFMAMPTMGSTAPATPLGALVTGDAEVVSAMVLAQLAYPGAPVFYSNYVSLMHPRTAVYISDLPIPLDVMAVQMAHAWNVPSLGGGSLSSDAPGIGWESGSKAGMGAGLIPLAGGEICGYLGMLAGSMLLVPEQLILDHEVCQNAYDYFNGFQFDPDDLALEVIEAVGPGSHFLRQAHTRTHLRDFRLSLLHRQQNPDRTPRLPEEEARETFARIARDHQPRQLPKESLAEMERILSAADAFVEGYR